ncbi:MAG: hypothetical protein EOR84_32470 [Mesorhizobium sp.]|nr:hypothetical protein [Mesorhizobium sp.]RWM85051.1 MAG: hypothetical protein EOR84_32470 [Mesorhizobium sp.]
MIGRSYRFALAVGGADGVKQCVCLLREEFEAAKHLSAAALLPRSTAL